MTVLKGTIDARNRVFSSVALEWEPQSTGGSGGPGGGSTQVSIKEILTSSGASVMDSTAGAIKVNVVAGSAAGDTTATVTQASTVWAVQLTQYSTTAQVSSVAGIVKVGPHDTNFASSAGFHFDSTGQTLAAPLRASTSARASLTQSSTSVTAQNANAARLQWTVQNNPTQQSNLYLKFGQTASTTDFDVMLKPLQYYEMPQPIYTGRIDAVWDSTGVGFARTCEWLA